MEEWIFRAAFWVSGFAAAILLWPLTAKIGAYVTMGVKLRHRSKEEQEIK